MIKLGMHLGYSRSRRNSKMKPFIFTAKNNAEIFDLEKTKGKMDLAKEFVKNLAQEKKIILFVATKYEARPLIENAARELNMPFVKERWLGGTLTNFKEIKSRIDHLSDLEQKRDSGALEKYTKKERLHIEREIAKLEKYLQGLKDCKNLPSALVAIDSNEEKIAVAEARDTGVPVIALMNNDCNPEDADYPVPGNDSAISSIKYFLEEIIKAYKEGYVGTN
ncbi:MAG: 30S ribosomal protein S2 [Candidatus Terrybacteria bacterium]|nr:30S ribosomal protein S2 [Candidatus Terrybacteria bacterium]